MKQFMLLLGVALVLPAGMALADNADTLDDITMQVVEGDEPDALLKRIELPERAHERAQERSVQGLDTANRVREQAWERQRINQAEETEALRAQRQEMHEYREQMQEQRREMQQNRQQMLEQMEDTRDAMRDGMGDQGTSR